MKKTAYISMILLAVIISFAVVLTMNKDPIVMINNVIPPVEAREECYNLPKTENQEYFTGTVYGSIYEKNETAHIYGACLNSQGHPVKSAGRITIRFPNGTALQNKTIMSNISNGLFNFTRRVPNNLNGNYFLTFNCTNGSLWATDFGEFQVPTFTDKITGIFATNPELNIRMKVLERVFANGEFQVEAVFSNKTGARVNPDAIILDIYYENDTIYNTARKTDFTQGSDGVWTYERPITSAPQFEVYSFHLTASKFGINVTAPTQQARISSGGPFSIRLTCPSIAYTDATLPCDLEISDEGDTGVESICTTWIDEDNDGEPDGGEPQIQTSQETVPGQVRILDHDMFIQSSFSTGDYIVRSKCSYVASSHPDSTASRSISIKQGNAQGGGGGLELITGKSVLSKIHGSFTRPRCLFGSKICINIYWWLLIIAIILGFLWYKYTKTMNSTAKWTGKIIGFTFKGIWLVFSKIWAISGFFGVLGLIGFIVLIIYLLVKFGVAR